MWTPEKPEDIQRLRLDQVDKDKMSIAWFGVTYAQHLDKKVKEQLGSAREERWKSLMLATPAQTEAQYRHLRLLERRIAYPDIKVASEHTASAYADWVYRISHPESLGSAEDRAMGVDFHAKLARLRKDMWVPQATDWSCIHNGLHEQSQARDITALAIDGKPMRGSPDLVFENRRTSTILIVEVKFSKAMVEPLGWANVMAQLWCYAQIDDFKRAKDILLRAELWDTERDWHTFQNKERKTWLRHRHTWYYDARNGSFGSWNQAMFGIYRAKRDALKSTS